LFIPADKNQGFVFRLPLAALARNFMNPQIVVIERPLAIHIMCHLLAGNRSFEDPVTRKMIQQLGIQGCLLGAGERAQ
jgi:hypothetical protein